MRLKIKFVGLNIIFKSLTGVLKIANKQSVNLPKICSLDYVKLVREKIINQEFLYPKLSKDYGEWKAQFFPQAKTFWHLGGDLLNAIQIVNLGKNIWAGTIPKGITDFGGKDWGRTGEKKSILFYALVLEEGYAPMNIKPRPLFGPANVEYEKNGFQNRLNAVVISFAEMWG